MGGRAEAASKTPVAPEPVPVPPMTLAFEEAEPPVPVVPEPQPDPFSASLTMMLNAHSTSVLRDFTKKRNAKAQALYTGIIQVLNEADPEPDLALYVVTLVYQQVMRDTCARAGIQ